jgi:hypothetical protein
VCVSWTLKFLNNYGAFTMSLYLHFALLSSCFFLYSRIKSITRVGRKSTSQHSINICFLGHENQKNYKKYVAHKMCLFLLPVTLVGWCIFSPKSVKRVARDGSAETNLATHINCSLLRLFLTNRLFCTCWSFSQYQVSCTCFC